MDNLEIPKCPRWILLKPIISFFIAKIDNEQVIVYFDTRQKLTLWNSFKADNLKNNKAVIFGKFFIVSDGELVEKEKLVIKNMIQAPAYQLQAVPENFFSLNQPKTLAGEHFNFFSDQDDWAYFYDPETGQEGVMENKKNYQNHGNGKWIRGADDIGVKVVAIFNRKITELAKLDSVKLLDDNGGMTVVECWNLDGKATLPSHITSHPLFNGVGARGSATQSIKPDKYTMTTVEMSGSDKKGRRWATLPVLPDGTAPTENISVPPGAKHSPNGKPRPVAYCNHQNNLVIVNVIYVKEEGYDNEYVSAAHFIIDEVTAEVSQKTVADLNRKRININCTEYEERILSAVGETFAEAVCAAVNITCGDYDDQPGPAWLKTTNGKPSTKAVVEPAKVETEPKPAAKVVKATKPKATAKAKAAA